MVLKSLFFQTASLFVCFSKLEDALKIQRFDEEKLSLTAEHANQCLFYLELNLDMFMEVFVGGEKYL